MNEEEKLTEIFGEKEVTEDSIMSEARRIFKCQESVGNPYSMHVSFEFATKELGKLKQRQEQRPFDALVIQPEIIMSEKTIDQKANEYADAVELDENTYPGDVETAFTCGYLQAESDLICKLFETDQFTMSKIAEMLGMSLMGVRNAVNQKEWQ